MAGRKITPPPAVAAASLANTGNAAADRVNKQTEQALQALQEQVRRLEVRVAALEAAP